MIPKKAKKVFTGILFDVYHWKQKMFDGSYKTYEGVKRKPSVQVIATTGKKIIMIKEEQPHVGKFTGLIGGWVENSEKPASAAKRELLEEIGMKAKKIKFWKKTVMESKIQWIAYYYIATDCKKIKEPNLEPGEKIKMFKVSFRDFLKITQEKNFRNKELQAMICWMKHNRGELAKFKKIILG